MGSSARGIAALIARVLEASAPGPSMITENGSTVHVEYGPLPGVRVRIVTHPGDGSAGMTVTEWESLAERPAAFPAELPFLANTIICDFASAQALAPRTVTYRGAKVPSQVTNELVAQSTGEGWVLDDPLDLSFASTTLARMHRGAHARHLMQVGDAGEGVVLQDMAIPDRTA